MPFSSVGNSLVVSVEGIKKFFVLYEKTSLIF